MILRVSLATVVLMAAALPARAQVLTPDHHTCANGPGNVAPADQEKACDAVIKLGGTRENLAIAYSNRGNSFLRRGENEKAIQDYGQAIRLDPTFADAYRNRGAAWFNLGNYDKAISEYDAVVRLEPGESSGYTDRCSARALLGQAREAKADCDKALALDPMFMEAMAWRALVLLQLGDIDAAEFDIIRVVPDQPKDPSLRYVFGMVLEAKGAEKEAAEQFQVARELDPEEFARLDKLYGRFRRH